MSNWFFHRGIPVMPEKTVFKAPRGDRTSQRMAIYAPQPKNRVSVTTRAAGAEPDRDLQPAWLPHCEQRLRRLARRARAAEPRAVVVEAPFVKA